MKYLGIDLGTSNSAIAGWSGGNDLKLFKTADGTDVLPSVIYIAKNGRRQYGHRAYGQALLSPDNVAQGFKRLMGTSSELTFEAAGITMSPEECSAEILRVLVGQAYTETGNEDIKGAVVTIPAAFNQMQSEATLRAAHAAGLQSVALLQEPIAAAMAATARSKDPSGIFLVYDLGGGTFDLALVQNTAGSVSILAHEGINTLGGRDFDRYIVNSFVRPWLIDTFDLPENFQADKRFKRLARVAFLAAEKAKIELSTQERGAIFAADDEVRVQDASGADVFIDIPITRADFENLIAERVDETIKLSRKVLKDNGYSHEEVDRIVFIGGPSKIPMLRERVARELAIAADFNIDPMTAVALGAAIYAESREWEGTATSRKKTRASTRSEGALALKMDYPARVTADKARLKVTAGGSIPAGTAIQIESLEGWNSGRAALEAEMTFSLPTATQGRHVFRVVVLDGGGRPLPDEGATLEIDRGYASSAGIPATQTIAVKVVGNEQAGRNSLEPIIEKGTSLPAEGSQLFRAARALKSGDKGHIDLELYEKAPDVDDPEISLAVGVFRISGDDLPEGQAIARGDEIRFDWKMSDSGILTSSLDIPALQQVFDVPRFYVPQAGHKNFEGDDGARLVEGSLEQADRDLERAEEVLEADEISDLRSRLEQNREEARTSADPDTRRAVNENARRVRQDLHRLLHTPEHRGALLLQEMERIEKGFRLCAEISAEPQDAARVDDLGMKAREEIARGTKAALDTAEQQIEEMRAIAVRVIWSTPEFLVGQFQDLAEQRYLAIDKGRHDELVAEGAALIEQGNFPELGRVLFQLHSNQVQIGGDTPGLGLASIMRA